MPEEENRAPHSSVQILLKAVYFWFFVEGIWGYANKNTNTWQTTKKTLKRNYRTNGGMSSRSHWLSVLRLYVMLVILWLWWLVEAHGAARAFRRHWIQTCCLQTLFHKTRHLGLLTETGTQEQLSWKRDNTCAGFITGIFLFYTTILHSLQKQCYFSIIILWNILN